MNFRAAVAGSISASVALGVAELTAGLLGAQSLILAVGSVVVDVTPGPIVKAAIEALGTNDKPFLIGAVTVISIALGAALGPLADRRFEFGVVALVMFGALGFAPTIRASATNAEASLIVAGSAVISGIVALRVLLRAAAEGTRGVETPGRGVADRRRFLAFALTASGSAAAAAVLGRRFAGSAVDVEAQRQRLELPAVQSNSDTSEVGLAVPGLTSLVVPEDRFYRIDTALVVPRVNADTWRLRLSGMVDHPLEFTLADLLAMPLIEESVTLACVSNEVGGDLVGNALWRGLRLADVLREAGVQPGATQIVGRSVDGFTTGFPTEVALDGRPALIAVGMNGRPLPAAHGFPARLVIPGLYGYVSATKWLAEIELTALEAFDAYWIPRGWSKFAPIKTQSRIDVPRQGTTVRAGTVPIAGVAWGGIRSISRVEVRITPSDGGAAGPWVEARLGDALSASSWRQWVLAWDATPGSYRIEVRATDGTGETQTEAIAPPAPDGATGWHNVRVRVV